jgi:hypothetical protein
VVEGSSYRLGGGLDLSRAGTERHPGSRATELLPGREEGTKLAELPVGSHYHSHTFQDELLHLGSALIVTRIGCHEPVNARTVAGSALAGRRW